MSGLLENVWPPTKSWKRSILWALVFAFFLQIAVPTLLALIGANHAAFYSSIVGFWPMMWATGRGWNSSVTLLGYLVMFSINTLAYGILMMIGIRISASLRGVAHRDRQSL
jgi:hypothetical protein